MDLAQVWADKAAKVLKGRTIVDVRYLQKDEAKGLGWATRSVVLILDSGLMIYPSSDDEGNDAGVLFTTNPTLEVIPVIF